MATKTCTKCRTNYPATRDYFYRHRGNLRPECKKCSGKRFRQWCLKNSEKRKEYHRKYRLKHKKQIQEHNNQYRQQNPDRLRNKAHNLAEGEYQQMLKQQNGVCAICGLIETVKTHEGKVRSLSIDHNHITGKIRGLLCNKCNNGIGKLSVDEHGTELLCSAISYIRNTDEK